MLSQTLSGVPLATLDSIALSAPARPITPPPPRPPSTIDRALDVVLERTRPGDEELTLNRFGLGAARWQLLAALDGVRALGELTQPGAHPNATRLVSDAARLVAFGLCRSVRGELPRSFMIAAMNLTMRIPRMPAPTGEVPALFRPAAMRRDPPRDFPREGEVRPLYLAAAIVTLLVCTWVVFEVARG